MHARLPIVVAPAHHETATSYIARLANLHGIPFSELWRQVSRPRQPASTTMVIAADRLAAVTGIPHTRLARALIEIRHPEPDWLAFRHEPQHGCPRCTGRHPGGTVRQLFPHHRYVCTRHRIWIGPPDLTDQPYPILDQLPEIVAAQRAHLRLLNRLGPAATYDAVLTGFLICGHRWDQQPDPITDLDARHAWRIRVDALIPPGTEQTTFSTSRLFAATYPEAVKIAALVGSLHWRRQAAGDPDGQRRFAAEIGRRLGQPDYRPKVTKDSIAHWIDDDCWRPPTLPPTTYRTLPGFGNPTITKPNQHSLDRHHRSARWFARNRRGGRVILYHRHVGSVLARDWSRKMEEFVGTVEASAETRTFNDIDRQEMTLDAAVYVRPTARKSDYLDAAAKNSAGRDTFLRKLIETHPSIRTDPAIT
ncbi:hypothetical protein Ari01nite_02800 [Paractinoplanes rishiriensis]|uniref:TniQ domain-containing protein n=1 Tax=Paractinoplanes rishiriensis TaxID=1050105 RepID=A0A919JSC2_9ACTN|nr:hypothetical protein Ari01nite_02800 [Actinoplanes rishiriensis]